MFGQRLLHSRREFLAGLAAAGGGAMLFGGSALAQIVNTRRLDLHQHHFSPAWITLLTAQHALRPIQGYEVMRAYSPARTLETMDEAGVSTAFLSTPTPGVWFGSPDDTRRVAREQNEYGARLMSDYPGRFGLFAVLPLPDIEASLLEIEYALDTLNADGFCFITSYPDLSGETRWPGDPAFSPIQLLPYRRRAVVYTHASAPACCMGNFHPHTSGPITLEFSTDLARAIISIIESGTATRTPNITYIWSHGGGTIFAARYLGADGSATRLAGAAEPNTKLYHLRRFYYDTAAAADPVHIGLLKMVVSASQIVFGTDTPWGNPLSVIAGLQASGLTPEELRGVERENALRFMPKYG